MSDPSPPPISDEQYPNRGKGIAFAAGAFGWWAFIVPSYFKVLSVHDANPFEILAQRVLFGIPILLLMLALSRKLGEFMKAATQWASLKVLIPSTVLIAINWFFFIYAVSTDRLSHASLGYYINPLFSIAMGFLFLGERPRPVQWGSIVLACTAVLVMGYAELNGADSKGFPWLSILLPASFGTYGLLRKQASVGPSVGLTFEMMLLLPVCVGLVIWLSRTGEGIFFAQETKLWVSLLMILGGVVTIVPLICFTNAVKLLPLSTVGLLQYTAPTGQLLLSVVFFGEHFTPLKFAAFAIIWVAVGIYSWDMIRGHRASKAASRAAAKTEMLE
ncbi:MAG: EamA family transporter RarD [Phycisphaerales bacterium]|nr:EamA family transporter RarD [Phycisphaerales bacterium]